MNLEAVMKKEAALLLPTYDRYQVLLRKGRDGLHEPIMKWAKRRWRGDPIAEVVAEETTYLTTRLQPGHVAIEIQTVNARGGQRHVVAQYGGDVGAWHRRRLPTGMDGQRRWCHSPASQSPSSV